MTASAQYVPVLCRSYAIAIVPISKSYGIRRHIRSVAQARAAERTGGMMSNSEVNDRIIDPMMAIANCSTRQRIIVVGTKSMELMMQLHRRGYLLAAAAGNCGLPAAQYEVALVDWRRRTLHALDAAMDWLDDFLSPRAVLVIWLDAQKAAAKDSLRAAVTKHGFVVLEGAEHPCGSVLLARRSQAFPVQQAA